MKEAKVKIPRSLGECADLLYALREARLAAQKQVDHAKSEEHRLKEYMAKEFGKKNLTAVAGKTATLGIDYEWYPTLKDANKFFAWAFKHKRYDLLYRQVNATAWRELHAAKKKVPGVEAFKDTKFSLTKLNAPKAARLKKGAAK